MRQVVGLGQPWGNCGTKPLKYFDQYSYTACKMDYEIQSLYEKYQCREAHMSGDKTGKTTLNEKMFTSLLQQSNF